MVFWKELSEGNFLGFHNHLLRLSAGGGTLLLDIELFYFLFCIERQKSPLGKTNR